MRAKPLKALPASLYFDAFPSYSFYSPNIQVFGHSWLYYGVLYAVLHLNSSDKKITLHLE